MTGLIETIETYLDFIQSPERTNEPLDIKAGKLMRLLDNLALLSYSDGVYDPNVGDEDTPQDYRQLYDLVGRNFSELGDYHKVLDTDPNVDTKLSLGDAIDDITDIAIDLRRALNVAESHGELAGQYEFALHYRIHWGYHLRSLQLYLFHQLTGF